MRTDVPATHVDVVPGTTTEVTFMVTNTSHVIDGVTVIVDGLDPSWVDLREPVVRMFPDETRPVSFQIRPPKDALAGNYLVVACIASTVDAQRQSMHDFWVSVEPAVAVAVHTVPAVVTRGSTASVEVVVENTGNVRATYAIAAIDQTREVDCRLSPAEVTVEPGERQVVMLTMRGPRPLLGQVLTRSVVVDAFADEVQAVPALVTFRQRPRIPRGAMTCMILAAIVTVWALIFYFVVTNMRAGDAKGKTVATEFKHGETEVPVAAVGATAVGRVTSASEGSGLPRVTVQAFRIVRGLQPVLSSAGATDDEGAFSLPALLPGTYEFTFSAEGFEPRTVPGPGPLRPTEVSAPIDVVLDGKLGEVTGSIAVPATASDLTFEVTATRLVDGSTTEVAAPGMDQPAPPAGQVEAVLRPADPTASPDAPRTADFTVTGLPTPATYRVRVEARDSAEFAPLVFEVHVDGGQVAQVNPLRPIAAPGSLQGIVVDGGGRALGDVDVTVTGGGVTVHAVTPTADAGLAGTFEILGLPTPTDYVVTFTKDGYSSVTKALALGAGEPKVGISAQLIGGLGSVEGTVLDGDAPPGVSALLGDVEIIVQGGGFLGTATSLTNESMGSFIVSNIPVPGDYTVTYRRPGYESQTVPFRFGDVPTSVPLAPVTLRRVNGRITGVIAVGNLGANAQITDVEILLDDGRAQRKTRASTTPFGEFSFEDVPAGSYTISFKIGDALLRLLFVRVATGQQVAVTAEFDAPNTQRIGGSGAGAATGTTTATVPTTTGSSTPTTTTASDPPPTTATTEPDPVAP